FLLFFFFFQAEDGIRDGHVTGVQTCALPILRRADSPLPRAESPSRFPRARRAPCSDLDNSYLPPPDGRPPHHELDPLLRLDGHWSCDLLQLRTQAQHLACGQPGIEELRDGASGHTV